MPHVWPCFLGLHDPVTFSEKTVKQTPHLSFSIAMLISLEQEQFGFPICMHWNYRFNYKLHTPGRSILAFISEKTQCIFFQPIVIHGNTARHLMRVPYLPRDVVIKVNEWHNHHRQQSNCLKYSFAHLTHNTRPPCGNRNKEDDDVQALNAPGFQHKQPVRKAYHTHLDSRQMCPEMQSKLAWTEPSNGLCVSDKFFVTKPRLLVLRPCGHLCTSWVVRGGGAPVQGHKEDDGRVTNFNHSAFSRAA